MMRTVGMALLLLGMVLGGVAPAQPPKTAREHFERGTALFDLRRYREAAAEYEAAFELRNEPSLLYNIGQAYRRAGDLEAALGSYRSYLRRAINPPNRAEVERHIAALQRELDARRAAAGPSPTDSRSTSPPPTAPPLPSLAPASTAPASSAAPAGSSLALTAAPSPPERTPLYKKWWLWTAVGVVAAGAAVGIAVAATTPKDAAIPAGATALQFH